MLGTEVAVKERGLEVHECLRDAEESLCLRSQVSVEERKHEPFELHALLAVGLDPLELLHRESGRVEIMRRLQEGPDTRGVLVHEGFAADQAVADEEWVARNVLERGDRKSVV